ncbi:Lariat debranching enzyme, partial [Fragariocoptes setiger]
RFKCIDSIARIPSISWHTMKIAVFGCLHGMLNEMYRRVAAREESDKINVDLVIVCGDCQTVRAKADLNCVSIPQKYYALGDFHEYYSGKKTIPKLTIFVGGNHEASNYLSTLPYGGWVCKNFYYLGYAGVINFRGLRIGGISGIHGHRSASLGRYEHLPFDQSSLRSVYHTREVDVYRLQQLSPPSSSEDTSVSPNEHPHRMDIFMSHDWPLGIYKHGNAEQLMRYKPHFRDEIQQDCLGNPLIAPLVEHIKARHWFAAHLHCEFRAKVKHDNGLNTEFLSLDKLVPHKRFMDIIDIEANNDDNNLYYDLEWLAILKLTDSFTSTEYMPNLKLPPSSEARHRPTHNDLELVQSLFAGNLKIPNNFTMVEPVIYDRPNNRDHVDSDPQRRKNFRNPQTIEFCEKLDIKDPIADFVRNDNDNNNDLRESSHHRHGMRDGKNAANTRDDETHDDDDERPTKLSNDDDEYACALHVGCVLMPAAAPTKRQIDSEHQMNSNAQSPASSIGSHTDSINEACDEVENNNANIVSKNNNNNDMIHSRSASSSASFSGSEHSGDSSGLDSSSLCGGSGGVASSSFAMQQQSSQQQQMQINNNDNNINNMNMSMNNSNQNNSLQHLMGHMESLEAKEGCYTYEEQFKQLYEISDEPERKEFLDDLFEFMAKRGQPVNRIPIMAKQVLDLYELYNLVVARGGLVEVINKKIWREITKGLSLPSSITSAAFTLRTQYMKYLYAYECEKKNLSQPDELQQAIDGNRREGRRSSYHHHHHHHHQLTSAANNHHQHHVPASISPSSQLHHHTSANHSNNLHSHLHHRSHAHHATNHLPDPSTLFGPTSRTTGAANKSQDLTAAAAAAAAAVAAGHPSATASFLAAAAAVHQAQQQQQQQAGLGLGNHSLNQQLSSLGMSLGSMTQLSNSLALNMNQFLAASGHSTQQQQHQHQHQQHPAVTTTTTSSTSSTSPNSHNNNNSNAAHTNAQQQMSQHQQQAAQAIQMAMATAMAAALNDARRLKHTPTSTAYTARVLDADYITPVSYITPFGNSWTGVNTRFVEEIKPDKMRLCPFVSECHPRERFLSSQVAPRHAMSSVWPYAVLCFFLTSEDQITAIKTQPHKVLLQQQQQQQQQQ